MVTVVLDPGHGGSNPPQKLGGSSWNNAKGPGGLLEKTVTLQVAKAAKRVLEQAGATVLMTRTGDNNLGIVDRARVARQASAPAFVSIHFNAAPSDGPPAQGTETWIGNSPTQKSRRLADAVQASVLAATGVRNRGVKTGPVSGVINNANHGAQTAHCLVEISFMDRQPQEEARLRTPAYIEQLGTAVARGIMAYLAAANLMTGVEMALAGEEPEDAASYYAAGGRDETTSQGRSRPAPAAAELSFQFDTGQVAEVPMIEEPGRGASFSDLPQGGSVDDPKRMTEGFGAVMEAQVGDWNTVHAALLGILGDKRRAVCRINVPGGQTDYTGQFQQGGWRGTGFLVGPDLLLTNHHVINSAAVGDVAEAQFEYELSPDDLHAMNMSAEPSSKSFRLRPDKLFVTSKAVGGLDYTFVAIEPSAAEAYGFVQMYRGSFPVDLGNPVFLIHHPDGRPKEASLDDTEVVGVQSTVIHYAADTAPGSSGAFVLDRFGRLVALHHARAPVDNLRLTDGRTISTANEGIKLAAIAIDLENTVQRNPGAAGMASDVLTQIAGSDTLSGFFGGLGRQPRGDTDVEAVVNTYVGTDQDVDIGFWNIEWLANRYDDDAKLLGAATVIVDLNLDLWALSEVSPAAVQALVGKLQEQFGEEYEYALSEPDSPDSKQSTAVIWKASTLDGGPVEWPEPIASWWKLDSRDDLPFESVDGLIFNRYPRLYQFAVKGRDGREPFDFNLVPLHLKAMDEGSKRRRLASLLLAKAIEKMTGDGEEADWIVGGDVNAELATGDFDALTEGGFIPMSATDEKDGAFTYLKSPKSLIDNIFLTPHVTRTVDSAQYFIVAKDKSIDKYIKQISDHRPAVIRISLGDSRTTDASPDEMLRDLVDQITAPKQATRRRAKR